MANVQRSIVSCQFEVFDNSILMGNEERLIKKWMNLFVNDQAARPISTGKLKLLLTLHIQPINVVVCHGSLGAYAREI